MTRRTYDWEVAKVTNLTPDGVNTGVALTLVEVGDDPEPMHVDIVMSVGQARMFSRLFVDVADQIEGRSWRDRLRRRLWR